MTDTGTKPDTKQDAAAAQQANAERAERAAARKAAALEQYRAIAQPEPTGPPAEQPEQNEEQPRQPSQPRVEPRREEPAGGAQEAGDRTSDSESESERAPESGDDFPADDFERRLRLDNLSQPLIDAAKSLPLEDRQAMYEAIKKRHDRVDRVFHERNQLTRKKPETTQEEPKAEKPPKAPSLREKLADKAELLGDDVVEVLEAFFDEREQSLRSELAPQRQQPPQVQAQMEAIAAEVEANKARLADTYSSARLDGSEWDYIVQQANVEARNPYYLSRYGTDAAGALRAVFDRVMEQEGYVPDRGGPRQPASAGSDGANDGREFSQPNANGRGTTTRSGHVTRNSAASSVASHKEPPTELSKKERGRIIFEHMQRHPGDVDGARRAAGLEPLGLHPSQIVRPKRR